MLMIQVDCFLRGESRTMSESFCFLEKIVICCDRWMGFIARNMNTGSMYVYDGTAQITQKMCCASWSSFFFLSCQKEDVGPLPSSSM